MKDILNLLHIALMLTGIVILVALLALAVFSPVIFIVWLIVGDQ